ncbi:MAG TPA: alpha/beta fold hydrolase [Planctomycetota bacterium]|nr:alpha/beta fold hydrolase [Planctomycetota bacterium]
MSRTPAGNLRTLRASDLDLELELPSATPRAVALFVPGLFATSHFFRVDAVAGRSIARILREDRHFIVAHYDPRGLGRNRARRHGHIDFAARVADLRAAVAAVSSAHAGLPLFLLGHSFGGTTIYALLGLGVASVRGVITVGSPARLVPRRPPWEKLFTPATAQLVEQVAREDWVDLAAFSFVQNRIYSGSGNWRSLSLGAVRCLLRATAHCRVAAALGARSGMLASMVFRTGPRAEDRDFTGRDLQALLRARALERESAPLLQQLLAWGQRGGAIALPQGPSLAAISTRVTIPTLVAFSPADDMVRPEEVCAFDGPAVATIEVGRCGHGGFFFKPGPRDVLLANIESFLDDHA